MALLFGWLFVARSVALLLGWLFVARETTMKDDATLSGFVFTNFPQWNDQDIPPLLGGWRYRHASVVLENPDNEEEQTIAVFGGRTEHEDPTNSVILLNVGKSPKGWREGPKMKQQRRGHAVEVCNGWVYVIGGYDGNSRLNN